MPSRLVFARLFERFSPSGYIHFATEYRFECKDALLLFDGLSQFLLFSGLRVGQFRLCLGEHTLGFSFQLTDVVEELLDTHHVAVVGEGHAGHPVFEGFVY